MMYWNNKVYTKINKLLKYKQGYLWYNIVYSKIWTYMTA
jgi:hypothetical protein